MKRQSPDLKNQGGAAIIAYLVIALVLLATLAAVTSLVVHNLRLSSRRQNMITAYQYAQGGAALASRDVETAWTNHGSFLQNLESGSSPYVRDSALSSAGELVYARTITSPFTNQTVALQLRMADVPAPAKVKVFASATVGNSTQTVEAHLESTFGFNAAIISTSRGTLSSGVSKSTAQAGNTVVDGSNKGVTRVDGGILANGKANTNHCLVDGTSESNYGTANEIPDYTDPGSDHQLFDFGRFVAVAQVLGTHYTNLSQFVAVAAKSKEPMEGVIVVEIPKNDIDKLDSKILPYGINVRGTLVFRFSAEWKPLDKIINTATMNINAADFSGVNWADPSTYPTGYPPVYKDPSRQPANVDITGFGYENFTLDDDLPALMYNNAILDIHGNANICGAVYSPSFMEIENKSGNQIQYFKGALIGGGGIFFENHNDSVSVVSHDPAALDLLATMQERGKSVKLVYQK